jgi:hypothetical protein
LLEKIGHRLRWILAAGLDRLVTEARAKVFNLTAKNAKMRTSLVRLLS